MLPFNGYTWNFSQHAIGLNPKNLFPLLSAASLFEGQSGFGNKINEILIAENVLTSNIRDGKPDAWRDYQQILSETGLIYSTKIERNLRLTEAGRLLLQGEIGFKELMSIQSLRYQYPNGFKSTFLKDQHESGVLIKPGTLILRILLELIKEEERPRISIDQCQNFLLPIIRNKNWTEGYEKIRVNSKTDLGINRHARRNIQDWFKFLGSTDLFDLISDSRNVYITPSKKVISDPILFDSLCTISEDPASFWIPADYQNSTLISWFTQFGHIPTEFYAILENEISQDFLNENYVISPFDEEIEEQIISRRGIELSEIDEKNGEVVREDIDFQHEIAKINSGYIKRREKTKLHNDIIRVLAKHYRSIGCAVFEDRQSIDLLVKSPKDEVSIFEVKTATPRNIYQRTRLAVGQIMEYGYRYNQEFGKIPSQNIVLNVNMENHSWLKNYMNDYLKIGVVSVLGNELRGFPNQVLDH